MSPQESLDGVLDQFKDVCQIVAPVQFFVEFVCAFIVQGCYAPEIQYVTAKSLLKIL
jgi:hypothetical protein